MVEQLVAKEAVVTVFDINVSALDELRKQGDGGVTCIECDVSNHDQVVERTSRYHQDFGAADVLINNAGISLQRSARQDHSDGDRAARHRDVEQSYSRADLSSACFI